MLQGINKKIFTGQSLIKLSPLLVKGGGTIKYHCAHYRYNDRNAKRLLLEDCKADHVRIQVVDLMKNSCIHFTENFDLLHSDKVLFRV